MAESTTKAPSIEELTDKINELTSRNDAILKWVQVVRDALHWEHYFNNILKKYNSTYKVQLPKITPHVCRHTYCTKMAKKRVSPKALQYLMGHSEIGVTLDVYTTLTDVDVEEELKEIEARDVNVETDDDYKSDIIKFDDRRRKVD